jgi:hypothetical protein
LARSFYVFNVDDLFKKDKFDHPKLRYWQALATGHGVMPMVEVTRAQEGLGFAPARLNVIVNDDHGTPITDSEPWEPQLALTTVERGWRAPSLENEAVRFGLLLKMFFSQPEMRYGDGYFSSVLVAVLRDSDLKGAPEIAEVLKFVSVPPPLASPSKDDCVENIKAVLGRVAQHLVGPLAYTQDEAKIVVAKSLAYFLDERFSITTGRALGLYRDERAS